MQTINQQLTQLGESFTIQLADKVRAMQAAGQAIIGLQTGDPDFATPQAIMDAALQAMQDGHTHYTDSRGIAPLRQAIVQKMKARAGISLEADREILVTHGAIHAFYIALQAILSPNDHVLIPDPSWQTHANMVRVLRGEAIRVPTSAENRFLPTFEAWEASLTPKTIALVINSPNNPTGFVADQVYLEKLVDFAVRHNLYIISDEVYEYLVYDDIQHVSVISIPEARQRTLVVNSFSKTYAMTGWRIGYLIAPAHIIDQALKASQNSITNLAPFIQYGGLLALTNPDVQASVEMMVNRYALRRQRVLDLYADLPESPMLVTAPQGAFYFFLDLRALDIPDTEMAERLIAEAMVAVVPGSTYGEYGSGFLRMTIASSDQDIEAGFRAIHHWSLNAK